jgi:heme exporter protein A
VRWQGTRIRRLAEEYTKHLVYVGHLSALKDELTPFENLAFACRLGGAPAKDEALRWALGAFSVPDLPARKLSQGQKRRAALARLLLAGSLPLWLLDEPFAALDAGATAYTEELIGRHLGGGGSVVYTTHSPSGLDSRARLIDLKH